jgi:hypothetical protein
MTQDKNSDDYRLHRLKIGQKKRKMHGLNFFLGHAIRS